MAFALAQTDGTGSIVRWPTMRAMLLPIRELRRLRQKEYRTGVLVCDEGMTRPVDHAAGDRNTCAVSDRL